MKAIEQYFHVVLFTILSKVVQTFNFVDIYIKPFLYRNVIHYHYYHN